MKKRILSVLITVVMLIGMLPTAVFAEGTTPYDLWVGGVQVTSANLVIDSTDSTDITGGSATYDPATNTLTLDNFKYSGEGYSEAEYYSNSCSAAIYSGYSLNILLVGDSIITHNSEEWADYSAAIFADEIIVSDAEGGTVGSLTATGGDDADFSSALNCESAVIINSGKLTCYGGDNSEYGGDYSGGIFSNGSIDIFGGEVNAYAGEAGWGRYSIAASGYVSISGGVVTAGTLNDSCGIWGAFGGEIVTGGIVNAIGSNGGFAYLSMSGGQVTSKGETSAFWDGFEIDEGCDAIVYAGDDAASAVKVDAPTEDTYANKYVRIEPVKYDLYIGGVQFTSGNLIIDSTDSEAISGSATYTPELNTLTLNNFQYSGPGYKNEEYEYLYGALRVEGDNDLRIVFTGQNVIECTNGDERWGLYTDFNGDLHIKAETIDSCLTFIGGDVACGRVPVFDGNFVIYAGDNEADAKITAEDTFTSQYYTYSYVRYEPTLMVTFDYGTLGSETKAVLSGETVTPPAPVFAGKVLVGWYTDSGFTTEFNFSDAINTNKTIYAKFTAAVAKIEKTGTSGLVDTYTITYTDGTTTTFTVTNGEKGDKGDQGIQGIQGVPGADGHTPVITIQNGYWYIDGVNTNQAAQGVKGDTGNGISDISKTGTSGLVDTYTITYTNGTTTTFTVTNGEKGDKGDQGIQGIQGVPGADGHTPVITIQNGYWYIDGVNTNQAAQGVKGDTGNGISDISKTGTSGLVDTYTITYTNGTTTTFTVTNGEKGDKGDQGIQGIQGVPGADGHTPVITIQNGYWYIDGVNTNQAAQGVKGDKGDKGDTGAQGEKGDKGNTGAAGADGVGIAKIEKTSSDGNVDTYTITLTNGTTYTFTVTNGTNGTDGVDGKDGTDGEDGQTPYIGENGNWWIGDTDTGVKAAGDDGKDGAIIVATAVGGTALISNIALIAWTLIKKKRLF